MASDELGTSRLASYCGDPCLYIHSSLQILGYSTVNISWTIEDNTPGRLSKFFYDVDGAYSWRGSLQRERTASRTLVTPKPLPARSARSLGTLPTLLLVLSTIN